MCATKSVYYYKKSVCYLHQADIEQPYPGEI